MIHGAPDSAPAANARRWLVGGFLLGLTGGYIYSLYNPEQYTSEARIREMPSLIAERYGARDLVQPMVDRVDQIAQSTFSRNSLANIVRTYDLYPSEVARLPLEDVLELMSKRLGIQRAGAGSVVNIRFTHPDRYTAQRVTRDVMARLIDENIRERGLQGKSTVDFLKEKREAAAREWAAYEALAMQTVPGAPGTARAQLDRDLARNRYQSVSERLDEAQTALDIESRKHGSVIEVLDLPSLPEHPDNPRISILAIGAGAGLVAGLLAWAIRRLAGARTQPSPEALTA